MRVFIHYHYWATELSPVRLQKHSPWTKMVAVENLVKINNYIQMIPPFRQNATIARSKIYLAPSIRRRRSTPFEEAYHWPAVTATNDGSTGVMRRQYSNWVDCSKSFTFYFFRLIYFIPELCIIRLWLWLEFYRNINFNSNNRVLYIMIRVDRWWNYTYT